MPVLRAQQRLTALALLILVAWFGGAGAACAAPDTPEDLRNELLRGQTMGDWDGTLQAIVAQPAGQVGETLEQIFTNPEHTKRLDLVSRVAAYLASHPINNSTQPRILLPDLIFRRALLPDGEAYLDRVRQQLVVDRATGRRPDWDRLLDAAREHVERPASTVDERRAALTFLGQERAERTADVLATLTVEAKRQVASPAAGTEKEALETALLDALEGVLAFRFASAADAARQLEETKDLTLENKLRYLLRLKNGVASDPVAVRYMIEAVRKMESPVALSDALKETGSYPEVRKAILQRAAELKPRPVPEWTQFFVDAFRSIRTKKLVLDALDLLANAGFGGGKEECCEPVAEAIHERLAARLPPDPPDVRVRMVMTLGDLGSYEIVARQIQVLHERGALSEANKEEVVELVKAAGRCPGARVELLTGIYGLNGSSPDLKDALKTAVAAALGREGIRAADPAAAVAALTDILEGGGRWERATHPKTRKAALGSLGAYPGPETAEHLLRIAAAEGPEAQDEAKVAIDTLAKMMSAGPGGYHGALALVSLLERTEGKPELEGRRIEALKRLKDLPAGEGVPAEVRPAVLAAVRRAIGEKESEPLRAQAARTAADLADAEAVPAVTAWWLAQPDPERGTVLEALLEAVVQRPSPGTARPDSDARVVEALRIVGKSSPANAVLAVDWAEALVRSGARAGAPRPLLVAAHSEALLYRASTWPADAGGQKLRRNDLGEATTNLRVAHESARPEDAERLRPLLMTALERLAESYGVSEEAKALHLEAVALALRSKDPVVLQAGARLGRRLKEEDAFKKLLKDDELAELDRQLGVLRAALERSTPR